MAGNRLVGRPTNDKARIEPRNVAVAHDKARINDQRKVRPHSSGEPSMGIRPSGGAQKAPKKPRLNTDYMQLRDVPMDTISETELNEFVLSNPFARFFHSSSQTTPINGHAIAWQNGSDGIRIFLVQNGNIIDSKVIPNYQSLTQQMKQAKKAYYNAKVDRQDVKINWRRVARDAAIDYAHAKGITPQKMGELGREIPFNPPNAASAVPTSGGPSQGPATPGSASASPTPPSSGPGPTAAKPYLNMPSRPTRPVPGGPGKPYLNMPSRPTRPVPGGPGKPYLNMPSRPTRPVPGGPGASGPPTPAAAAAAPQPAPAAPTPPSAAPQLSFREKLNFLRHFDPVKYSDKNIRSTGMHHSSSPMVDRAFNNAIATPQGAELLRYHNNPMLLGDQMLKKIDPVRFTDEVLANMSPEAKQQALRNMNKGKGRSPGMNESWRMHTAHEQSPVTIRSVIQQIKSIGMIAKWNPEYQEFMVNFPGGNERTAHYTEDAADAIGTARAMQQERTRRIPQGLGMAEGYPDTSFEREKPAHDARIGDLGWRGHMEEPHAPALNQEFMGARDLHIERIHEVANQEIDHLIRSAAARMGFSNLMIEGEDEREHEEEKRDDRPTRQSHPSEQFETAIPRIRRRWIGERGHLPSPTHPLPHNIAGSGKDFRVKPGHNKSKKQPGNLIGSNKVNKVKPGFVG